MSRENNVWAMTLLLLMIMSVTLYCFSTHSAFRVSIVRLNTSSLSHFSASSNFSRPGICDHSSPLINPKLHKDCTTEPATVLAILDVALNIIFTIEFNIKLILAPDKKKFIANFVSILDICILFSYWVYAVVFYRLHFHQRILLLEAFEGDPGTLWLLNIMSMSQALRILRIFKVSKISRGLRVLILTIKKSIPELVLLGFLLMNGIFFFSCLIYAAEYWVNDTFISIPHAFWWSIVTLTTVGYGDTYPRQGAGYFVGSVTAICGCILTGLAIPIIGNNFNTYYMYMKNQIKEDKYIKDLQKDLVSLSSTLKTSNIKKLAALRDGQSHQCNMVMRRKITTANCPLTTPMISLDIANASLKMIAKGARPRRKKTGSSFYRFLKQHNSSRGDSTDQLSDDGGFCAPKKKKKPVKVVKIATAVDSDHIALAEASIECRASTSDNATSPSLQPVVVAAVRREDYV